MKKEKLFTAKSIFNHKNLFAIQVLDCDSNQEKNERISATVKELAKNGIKAFMHMAQGICFGYVLCSEDELETAGKILSSIGACLNMEPISGIERIMILTHLM